MYRLWGVGVLLATIGCVPNLGAPTAAIIQCSEPGECPGGMVCLTEIGRCVDLDSEDGRPPEVAFVLPRPDAFEVELDTTLTLVFTEGVRPATLEVSLAARGSGTPVDLNPVALDPPSASTFVFQPSSPLSPGTVYDVTVASGYVSLQGGISQLDYTSTFTTNVAGDTTPPQSVPSVTLTLLGLDRAQLDWTLPADAVGVVIARAPSSELGLSLPTRTPVGVGFALSPTSSVVSVTRQEQFVDAAALPFTESYAIHSFDPANNYAAPITPPLVDGVSFTWCPDETLRASIQSSESTATVQFAVNSSAGGPIVDLTPGMGVPAASPYTFPPGTVTSGETVHLRAVVDVGTRRLISPETELSANTPLLTITRQPQPIRPGATASFEFLPGPWMEFELEMNESVHPGAAVPETWTSVGTQLEGNVARGDFELGGTHRFRIRPTQPGCGDAPWTYTDAFDVGPTVFVRQGGTGDGSSPANASGNLSTAVANAPPSADVYVAEGAYTGTLSINKELRILGGFSSNFDSRDHTTLVSSIDGRLDISGAGRIVFDGFDITSSASAATVRVLSGANPVISNNRVEHLDGSGNVRALDSQGGPQMVVSNNTFIAGDSDAGSYAVEIDSPVTLTGNTCIAGTAVSISAGALLQGGGTVEGNTFLAGPADFSVALNVQFSNGTIRDNVIVADTCAPAPCSTIGLRVVNMNGVMVEGNRVYGGSGNESYGISMGSANDPIQGGPVTIRNNLVHGGTGADENAAISLRADNTVATIAHNTLLGGAGGAVVWNASGSPILTSNLLVCTESTTTGIVEASITMTPPIARDNDPLSTRSNVFVNCTVLYLDEGETSIVDSNGVNALDGTETDNFPFLCNAETEACETARYSGNSSVTELLSSVFQDVDGPDDDLFTMDDNNLVPTTSDPQVLAGGLEPGAMDCGTVETPAACGASSADFDGAVRTCPTPVSDCTSVGAHEVDGP